MLHEIATTPARSFTLDGCQSKFAGRTAPDECGRLSLPYKSLALRACVEPFGSLPPNMAGAVGIEPTMPESKSGALTAWPRPKKTDCTQRLPNAWSRGERFIPCTT